MTLHALPSTHEFTFEILHIIPFQIERKYKTGSSLGFCTKKMYPELCCTEMFIICHKIRVFSKFGVLSAGVSSSVYITNHCATRDLKRAKKQKGKLKHLVTKQKRQLGTLK